jgi:hypothetical protein
MIASACLVVVNIDDQNTPEDQDVNDFFLFFFAPEI